MFVFRKLPLSPAALMPVAVIVATFAAGPAPAQHDVVFPLVAQAMARKGLRAIGEEPFRARFSVDGEAAAARGDRAQSTRWRPLTTEGFDEDFGVLFDFR